MVDYKQFLNTAMKSLSLDKFCKIDFILNEFWKSKFPKENQKQQLITIEVFNQAFYQFFNREMKLLSSEATENILNECFSYLLKKNKKSISKRHLRKVIKRNFREIFRNLLKYEGTISDLPTNISNIIKSGSGEIQYNGEMMDFIGTIP